MTKRKYFEYFTKLIPAWFVIWLVHSAVKYPNEFATSMAIGIANGSIYALIAIGFGLIYNTTKILNLAHGEMFMLGAVGSTFFLVEIFGATSGNLTNFFLLFIAVVLAMVLGASVSWFSNVAVFSHLKTKQKMAPVVASLGVALIIQNAAIKWNGSGPKEFPSIIPPALPHRAFWPSVERTLVVLVVTLPIIFAAIWIITKSRNGLAIRAISDDDDTAQLMGINVGRTINWAFIVGGACAGAAGVIYAQQFQISNYSLGMEIGLIAYAAAIIGGVGHIKGTVLDGLIIGIVEALSNGVTSGLGYRWSQTAIYAVFILMLVYKPQGIWGTKESESV